MEVNDLVKLGSANGKDINGVFLGEWEGKEWVWNLQEKTIHWRVPHIRECIAAPPGYVILSADYSQIEVKLMAFLSGDPGLIAAINSGKDIHCFIATEVFGKKMGFTYEEMEEAVNNKSHKRHKELKSLRANVKVVTFGVPYGAGPDRVAAMTGMTKEEAVAFINAYFDKFPVLKQWLEKQGNQALSLGFTATPDGRKRFYVIPSSSDPDYDSIISQIRRWAGNHPIQAANADMLKRALVLIYSRIRGGILNGPCLWNGRLLLVVHDEIVMLAKKEDAKFVEKIMYDSMTEAYNAIIGPDLKNRIDVVVDEIWEKA